MLNKETIEKIAKSLRLKVEDLTSALTSADEQSLELAELSVFTAEELTARDTNTKKTSYGEGKIAGIEIAVKEQKEKLGIDVEGKDLGTFISAVQKKTLDDAKINPDAKAIELQKRIDALQINLQTEQDEKKTIQNNLLQVKREGQILGLFPEKTIDVLTKNEMLTSLNSVFEFVEEEGKLVVKKGGEIVKDPKTQNPLEPKEVINSYFKERKWVDESEGGQGRQGRGSGGDGGKGGVFSKMSELTEKFQSEGKSLNGLEFSDAVQAAQKANPHFDMAS